MGGLIVHEWLEPRGGAEKVVDAMLATFPDSTLVALWNDAPDKYHDVRESWLAHSHLRNHKSAALPFLPSTWRHIVSPTDDVDFTLVSSHLFAHHIDVRTKSGTRVPKFVYAHTPARYIWEPELDHRGRSPVVQAASTLLKPLDRKRAQEAVQIAANSRFVRDRIRRTWERDASVIYPPVSVEQIQSVVDWRTELRDDELRTFDKLPSEYILGASRFVSYKRLDWVIRAGEDVGIPVVIAGRGPEEEYLRHVGLQSRVPVHFVSAPSTPMLYALYQSARVFVFPAIEDFGIMPVEAQAAGTPVVTTSIGGATESHVEGLTGIAADEDSALAISKAVTRVLEDGVPIMSAAASKAIHRFSRRAFCGALRKWVDQ